MLKLFNKKAERIPLGRRFRSLKLWLVIRYYGVEGLQNHVRRHVELAQMFAAWVKADDHFELAVTPPLNLVCFRHRGGDEINQQLMNRLNFLMIYYIFIFIKS